MGCTSRFFPPLKQVCNPTWDVPLPIRLLAAKPWLVQEFVRHSPWKVLVAVIFLNVTTGTAGIPVFWQIMQDYPTPSLLARANLDELRAKIAHLGLGSKRAKALIKLSRLYIQDPPRQDRPRKSRPSGYPPTAISHYPWMGRYALDSYRIFCLNEWQTTSPLDKELRKWVIWRHAVNGEIWDPIQNIVRRANQRELHEYCDAEIALRPGRELLATGYHAHGESLDWWGPDDVYQLPSEEDGAIAKAQEEAEFAAMQLEEDI